MSLEYMFEDEQDPPGLLLDEAQREGEFEMSIQHINRLQESIVIPMLNRVEHTEEHPFCSDWTCPCHADIEAINKITSFVMDGLLSWHEANMILRGEYRRAS